MGIQRELLINSDLLANAIMGKDMLVFDGGMGSLIQSAGLDGIHRVPDILNLTHASEIEAIQRRYVDAGAEVITTNTFSSNALKLDGTGVSVANVYAAAAEIARLAGAKLIAGDIGPTGSLLAPMGDFSFDEAYNVFAEQAKAAQEAGCDLIVIETMSDLAEARAAVLAAVEQTDLPVFATMTFGDDGRTFLGTTPAIAATTLFSLGVQAVGINCSVGPEEIAEMIKDGASFADCAFMAQPNAGLPYIEGSKTAYKVGPEEFAGSMRAVIKAGANIVGGCCGTTPEHIRALAEVVRDVRERCGVPQRRYPTAFIVASAQEMIALPQGSNYVYAIGERINPTGRKILAEEIRDGRYDRIVADAVAQQKAGASILDVNVGVPGIDEVSTMREVVNILQSSVTTPLQIDSSNPDAVEAAVRVYAGRVMVNSVNGKRSSLDSVLPIVSHYGCSIVGLTLDEDGIPPTAEGRLAIAQRIVDAALANGIPQENIAIDCLVMSASTSQQEVHEVLKAVELVKRELGVRTVLGVSNVSFGLPQRPMLNATFLAAALGSGLDFPILNPIDRRYADVLNAFRVLNGQDCGCFGYIAEYADVADPYEASCYGEARKGSDGQASNGFGVAVGAKRANNGFGEAIDNSTVNATKNASSHQDIPGLSREFAKSDQAAAISEYILSGRREPVAEATRELLEFHDSSNVIDGLLIPLLDVVGEKYESGDFFLPQLMAAAEAARESFSVIKENQAERGKILAAGEGCADASRSLDGGHTKAIVLATVEGDIHDIGKNIVSMLLENYGYRIIDLGRDVCPDTVLGSVRKEGAGLVGLSALMTTTVGAMEETVRLLHAEMPNVKVMVGGAVVTQEYADSIGADYYASDAAASARIAEEVLRKQ